MLHAVGANTGQPITISTDGNIADDLPRVSIPDLGHLRVNGWLTNRRDGDGWRTGYGPRVRNIAERWGITLPSADVSN